MAELAVTAIGVDRPGIVAAIAEVLRDRGGNVEESAMTILRGRFAMMLLVDADDAPDELRAALVEAVADLDLEVAVSHPGEAHESEQPTHVLSVYGGDRPGIIAGVTRRLADLEVNITDLSTRLLPPDDEPVYAMVLEIVVPAGLGATRLDAALTETAEELGVDHTLRPLETETY